MKYKLIITLLLLSIQQIEAQNFWKKISLKNNYSSKNNDNIYHLDFESLKAQLKSAPYRGNGNGIIVYIPTNENTIERFLVYHAPVMEKSLENKYNMYSYSGIGLDDKSKYIRINTSRNKFNGMILTDGKVSLIDPYLNDKNRYLIHKKTSKKPIGFECHIPSIKNELHINDISETFNTKSYVQKFRTYRLALSVTGEYTQYYGGTKESALEELNTTMTRVNGILEKDLAVNLIMIDNDNIIYTDPENDPYSPSDSQMLNWPRQLQTTLDQEIGSENYDLGHLFSSTGYGGYVESAGSICQNGVKGKGYSSPTKGNEASGIIFDLDVVAHEFGHILGAYHTFGYTNEHSSYQVEPGSGSTIMSYPGLAGKENANVQNYVNSNFHHMSMYQIALNLESKDSQCGIVTPLSNIPPIVSAKPNIIIPKGTAFYLEADATDMDGDELTYCWEQMDPIIQGNSLTVSPEQLDGPIFKSIPPKKSPRRYFPDLQSVLSGRLSDPGNWETVSNVMRDLSFVVTVRDNNIYPQTNYDFTKVRVSNAGPFKVTYPNVNQNFKSGEIINITWDVADTDKFPIFTRNVKISITSDDGKTFQTLVESTPNTGTASVKLPTDVISKRSYLMIEAIGNVYYAVSSDFSIGYSTVINCTQNSILNNSIEIPEGDLNNPGVLNLKINTEEEENISSIKLGVDIEHPYLPYMTLSLTSPNKNSSIMWFGQCEEVTSTKMNAIFTDSGSDINCEEHISGDIKPLESFSNFQGKMPAGTWDFEINNFIENNGFINSLTLEVCKKSYTIDNNEKQNVKTILYPNPSKGIFHVNVMELGLKDKFDVKVYNMSGSLLLKVQETNQQFTLDLSSFKSGIYLLNIETGGKKISEKIIKL